MRREQITKQLRGALLPLFVAIILTACGWNAKVDTASWQYHAFEDIGIAMLLPEDLTERDAPNAVYHGDSEELQLIVTALDELFADTEKLAASVSKETGQEAEIVSAHGVELVRAPSVEQERRIDCRHIGSDGDTYLISISVDEACKEKRAAALLSAVLESVCGSGDVSTDPSAKLHPGRAAEQAATDYLVLVNKRHKIPDTWEDSITLAKTTNGRGETIAIEKTACKAFFGLQRALAEETIRIDLASAYGDGGEYETGLALDLYLDDADVPGSEEIWARVHARLADHGFILRNPEGGAYDTGVAYEPRHIRYVGVEAAGEIAARGITLEEYLGALPDAVDYLVLVNAEHALPELWEDEVEIVHTTNRHGEDVGVERVAYKAYCALRDALAEEGVHLDINSAYRSVADQQKLAENYLERYGEAYVKAYVAVPGYSEHHTGLAIDLYLESVDVWAKIHARLADYGFILRYPEGKEAITGYAYEPWHIRFVGVDAAREISERGVALEEYLDGAA